MIETKRLLLNKYSASDFGALHKILSDPVTMSFWPVPFSEVQSQAWFERVMKSYDAYGFGRMTITLKETGELIGDCGIVFDNIVDGKIENDLGYIIHHPHWKNGYASEAANAVKEFAFDSLKLDRVCANMAFDNTASVKTAEKIGMIKEKEFFNTRNRNIKTYLFSTKRNSK